MKKAKKQLEYRGISCDSDQEIFFLYWAFELFDKKIFKSIERSPSFKLSEPYKEKVGVVKQLKTKKVTKTVDKTILREHIYTPEFKISFYHLWPCHNDEARKMYNMFHKVTGELPFIDSLPDLNSPPEELYSSYYFEVKPQFDYNNMTRLFKVNQKWMFDKHKIFINLVKPLELFEETFVPKEYLKTTTGKQRKINFKVRTFEEWLSTIN